ncbi:Fpg/Nei family DNA glycosylase [Rudaeicoccus suwonensis]|uniref:DNA-(apurinic or apyrimidinic site) lyase n=1 Tax=Rudaeicoccus suwonensis TaxID=657409 RepID=A0A561ECL0_9MICO|nr:DNA-formamidopyrimidine glycosylase family protein [Rudaeicoccus suwonensis]TWE13342.1 endonuclease-8 [Rudaeicoccus suwonensis]
MPEGDVVRKTAQRLDQALAGRPLVGAELRWPSLGDRSLHGMTTTEVVSRGKHLLHRLDSGLTLHSHLRMEGSWRVRPTSAVTPKVAARSDIRALLATDTWAAIGYRLGLLELFATREEDRVVGHLGPDILSPEWDADEAVRRLRRQPAETIGAALLDQRNLAGIGTMFAAEALFEQQVPPWQPVAQTTDEQVHGTLAAAHRLMTRSMDQPLRIVTERTSTTEDTRVHARSGRPCLRCGGTVRVAMIGTAPQERTMFYCPTCQGGLGPTDDGRTQRPLNSQR